MENKILVADDSPTIQKVISITLANKDYILDSAHSEQELLEKVGTHDYQLVLLDYNLSETATGLDLTKQIKKDNPNIHIMAMLGTFDSVDDNELEDAGFSDKIVKPFESSKFIQKIENIFVSSAQSDVEMDEDIFSEADADHSGEEENEDSFDSDEWSMAAPDVINDNEEESVGIEDLQEVDNKNPLRQEMAGWGMSVPEVIGASSSHEDEESTLFPPSIEGSDEEIDELVAGPSLESSEQISFDDSDLLSDENDDDSDSDSEDLTQEITLPADLSQNDSASFSENEVEVEGEGEEQSLPDSEDLDYPSLSLEDEKEDETAEDTDRQPQLTSLDELDMDDDYSDDEDLDATDPQLIIGPSEDSPDLINSINDDISPDEFWAADVEDSSGESVNEEIEDGESDAELLSLGDEDEEDYEISAHTPISEEPKTTELDESSRATLDALSNLNEIGPKLEGEEREVGPKLEVESREVGPKLEKVDRDSLAQQIKTEILNELKPLIKEIVQESVKEALQESNTTTAEKVAWEIIPDLAENLIRKEVKEISQKVMSKHSLN